MSNNSEAPKNINIPIYNVAKCFDKLEHTSTSIDLFTVGVNDDKFITITNSNMQCEVAVKTPWGAQTARTTLQNIEMQGTVLAGLKCSVSIDTIGKECLDKTHDMSFKYKNCVSVPPLGFIDDILAITTCSPDSIRMNAIMQAKLNAKLLELGPQKCSHIHIGKKCDSCPTLNIYNDSMLRSNRERYLRDILTSKC